MYGEGIAPAEIVQLQSFRLSGKGHAQPRLPKSLFLFKTVQKGGGIFPK